MSDLGAGTLHLRDEEFVEAFESCRLPASSFHHADHIRLAWIYLRSMGEPEAAGRVAECIQRFAAHSGKADKFHATMTRAWMRLVAAALARTPSDVNFTDFIAAHRQLLDCATLVKHYSPSLLASDAARLGWVAPDLFPLPELPPPVRA